MTGKKELRLEMLEKRRSLGENEIKQKSGIICNLLEEILGITDVFVSSKVLGTQKRPLPEANTVMLYLAAHGEVDLDAVLKRLFSAGKRVVVPVSDTVTETIILSGIQEKTRMRKSSYGIPEPEEIIPVCAEEIDVIIVPGAAFDKRLNRIGHGKGYYDKLLAECGAYKIGVCYDFQLVNEIPADKHDIPMDMIITDRRIIS